MVHQKEKTEDKGMEKHVPVVEKVSDGFLVKVGSVPHPMEAEHHIVMVEIFEEEGRIQRKYLEAGDEPQAFFKSDADQVTAREYCNLHGLWKA
jgi:superoxide reductase